MPEAQIARRLRFDSDFPAQKNTSVRFPKKIVYNPASDKGMVNASRTSGHGANLGGGDAKKGDAK